MFFARSVFCDRYDNTLKTVVSLVPLDSTLAEGPGGEPRLLCRILHQNPASMQWHGCPSRHHPSDWLAGRIIAAACQDVAGAVPQWVANPAAAFAALTAAVAERRPLVLRTRSVRRSNRYRRSHILYLFWIPRCLQAPGTTCAPGSTTLAPAAAYHSVVISAGADPAASARLDDGPDLLHVLVVTETCIDDLVAAEARPYFLH